MLLSQLEALPRHRHALRKDRAQLPLAHPNRLCAALTERELRHPLVDPASQTPDEGLSARGGVGFLRGASPPTLARPTTACNVADTVMAPPAALRAPRRAQKKT